MPQANLTDVRQVDLVVPVGDNESSTISVNHGLQDQDGNPITPDRITAEIYAIDNPGTALDPVTWSFLYARSDPEDGTYGVRIFLSAINDTGEPITFSVNLVAERFHSIQSRSHY